MKITANGIRNGIQMTVEVTDEGGRLQYLFNGSPDAKLKYEIADHIEDGVTIGGTYFPETEALQVYAVLCGYFFDRNPDITAEGITEEIPQPDAEGGVY